MTDHDLIRLLRGSGIEWQSEAADRLAALATRAEPCPYVVTSDEGTSYCRLAAAGPAPEPGPE